MDLKELFNGWARTVKGDYTDKQWLLSKWEVIDGIEWPAEKIQIMLESIRSGLELTRKDYVADFGCGGGWILNALKPHCRKIIGTDFSWDMLENALRFCPKERFVCGSIGQLPFRDQSFDRALSYFVFLNFQNDYFIEQAILDILRTVKPGGRVMIGQLPDRSRSGDYDLAKKEYLEYCRGEYTMGKSNREIFQAPQKLFDRDRLVKFFESHEIRYLMRDAFNPFYRPGAPKTVSWRFDLILQKAKT